MAIEFRCPNCDKLLKTGDDKAGKTAKCPQCASPVTVPVAAAPAQEFEEFPGDFEVPAGLSQAAAPAPQIACPVCGAKNDAGVVRCYACGEELHALRPEGPATPTYSAIWRRAWELWNANLGINVASALIAGLAFVGIYILFIAVMVAGFAGVGMAGPGGGNDAAALAVFLGVMAGFYVVFFLVYGYIMMGLTNLALRQLHQREVGLGAMFPPVSRLPAFLFATLVVGLGMFVFMVPGYALMFGGQALLENDAAAGLLLVLGSYFVIFLGWALAWIFFWPVFYAVVDRPSGVIAPVVDGVKMALANLQLSLLLALTHAGLLIAGMFLTCYIGLLFAMPLSFVLFAVAYDRCSRARPPLDM